MKTSFTRRLATAALSLSILAAPVAVLAADTTTSPSSTEIQSIKDQIESLLDQVASLTKHLGELTGHTEGDSSMSSTTPSGMPCPVPPRNLGMGSHGDDVLSLQKFLAEDPTLLSSDSTTGFFGPKTMAAVKLFQSRHGVTTAPTGFVGPMTRDFLGKHCGELLGLGHMKDHGPEHEASSTEDRPHGPHPGDHGGPGAGNHHGSDDTTDTQDDH